MTFSNTQDLECTPLSICRCVSTADAVSNRDAIEWPPIEIVCKRYTAALLTVTKNVTCAVCDQYDISNHTKEQYSHPTVPVFGMVDRVAVIAPPNKRLAVGIVHVASAIVNVVAVPALPSVGGG